MLSGKWKLSLCRRRKVGFILSSSGGSNAGSVPAGLTPFYSRKMESLVLTEQLEESEIETLLQSG